MGNTDGGTSTSSDKVWNEAVRWIENNGGCVHPNLHYDGTRRQVYLGKQLPLSSCVHGDDDDCNKIPSSSSSSSSSPPLAMEETIDAGTTLLKIPDSCLITLHSVEADHSFGKTLFGVVHSLIPFDEKHHRQASSGTLLLSRKDNANFRSNGGVDAGLYHEAQDVILALYLAYLQHQLDREEEQPSNNSIGPEKASPSAATHPWQFYQPYLATLPPKPSSSSANPSSPNTASNDSMDCHLPRQWSATILQRRLQGTSLYNRVLLEQTGLKREYELVKNAWLNHHHNNQSSDGNDTKEDDSSSSNQPSQPTTTTHNNNLFPSFELYDNMMVVLTSRGFSGLGYDGVDALIPLLDLLNHVRGTPDAVDKKCVEYCSTKTIDGKSADENAVADRGGPDIRYERFEKDNRRVDDGGPLPKRQRMENGAKEGQKGPGGVRVSTSHSMSIGSTLRMTYGAKGNEALLGRYGFCIPNNVEPDGSCNDVLEIVIKPNEPPVKLQRGPKAYCYGPFVKALDLCRGVVDKNNDNSVDERERHGMHEDEDGRMNDAGGLEAFLDSCDNEFDDDCIDDEDDDLCDENEDLDDYFYKTSTNLNATQANDSRQTAMMINDLHAIDALKGVLQNVKAGYEQNPHLSDLPDNCSKRNNSNDEDRKNEHSSTTAEDQYCAILVRSEMTTLDFYLAAADLLRRRLAEHLEKLPTQKQGSSPNSQKLVMDTTEENYQSVSKEVVHEQINSLVSAFLSIRYPQVKII